jgi:hypothetical protein
VYDAERERRRGGKVGSRDGNRDMDWRVWR